MALALAIAMATAAAAAVPLSRAGPECSVLLSSVSRLPSLSLGKEHSIESLDTVQNEEREKERKMRSKAEAT